MVSTFQLRKLKERSKTEVDPRRIERSEREIISKLWFGESAVKNKVAEKGVRDKEKIFEEMVDQVKRVSSKREVAPESDCETYFSDD